MKRRFIPGQAGHEEMDDAAALSSLFGPKQGGQNWVQPPAQINNRVPTASHPQPATVTPGAVPKANANANRAVFDQISHQTALAAYYSNSSSQSRSVPCLPNRPQSSSCCFGGGFLSPQFGSMNLDSASSSASSSPLGWARQGNGQALPEPALQPSSQTNVSGAITPSPTADMVRTDAAATVSNGTAAITPSKKTKLMAPKVATSSSKRRSKARSKAAAPPTAEVAAAAAAKATTTHINDATHQVSEDILVHELNDLSITERQQIMEDVHGVSQNVHETPQRLNDALDAMQKELDRISSTPTTSAPSSLSSSSLVPSKSDRQIFEKALFYHPKKVQDRKLRAMFVRCENYDGVAAAKRYIKYWSYQYQIADGDWDTLLKPGGMTAKDVRDMDGDPDNPFLDKGLVHILPKHDQSGRLVVLFCNRRCTYKTLNDLGRVCVFTLMHALMQDVNAQINGIVAIAYECVKEDQFVLPFEMDLLSTSRLFHTAMPMKYQAFHFCYDDSRMRGAMLLVQMGMGKYGRVRFRSHFGTDTECRYQLMTFGIPASVLPVDETTSTIVMDEVYRFLDGITQRQKAETEASDARQAEGHIEYPTRNDILMGRGRPYQEHHGNRRLNNLIEANWADYEHGDRQQKMALFNRIVQELKDCGTRFLCKRKKTKDDDSEWELVDDVKARQKVSHTFRNKPILTKYHAAKNNSNGSGGGKGGNNRQSPKPESIQSQLAMNFAPQSPSVVSTTADSVEQ